VTRLIFAFLLTGCAAHVLHAETFVKRQFGFIGPRELTLVGSREDLDGLGRELGLRGFHVLEAPSLEQATTRYVAEVGGICGFSGAVPGRTVMKPVDLEWLHVTVSRRGNGERLFSARLYDDDRCPEAFYAEAADGIARNWTIAETPDAGLPASL
jgi:hypothetical protein